MSSVVEFVALGPGGTHLVTARALAALHAVQYVYYPELGGKSQARELLVQLGISSEKLRGYTLPMSHNREAALKAYAQYYYCELVERPNALYLHELEAIQAHPFTYFSLLICKSHQSRTNR